MADPPRIASLLPSATEIICGLGLRDGLVGVSHECDWPPDVVGLPVLTSARVRPHPTSGAIDREVRDLVRDALAVYEVDTARLRELAPDVIVTQDLCDVCAVSFEDVCRAARELANPDLVVVNTHPTTLQGIREDVRRVAAAVGRETAADELLAAMDRRIEAVRARAADLERPGVLAIEWLDPVMLGGLWTPELIELAGGRALVALAGERAPTLDDAQLRALDPPPDVVLVKPCGFDVARTLAEAPRLRAVLARIGGPALAAGRVFVADGNAYFNRPGPRIAESTELLAACLHPEAFADLAERHREAYVRLDPGPPP